MDIVFAPKCGGKRLKRPSAVDTLDRPLLSIVTVVLNGAKELESSICSVIHPSYENVEYIILDGGSTDGTIDLLNKYEDSIDYWLSEPDNGLYDALNKAVRLARGRWVCILGSDDTLCSDVKMVADYLIDERTIYYGDVFMTGSKKRYDGRFGAWKLSRRNICQQAIFYPRSVFKSQQFNLKYRLLADWEFNLRCYCNPQFRFKYIPVLVANYNDVTGKSSAGSDMQFLIDHGDLIRECLPWPYYAWHRFKRIARKIIGAARGSR
jgi:glycosyltransferase involved in cell wall biosynthesis